jgi:hypothetical protein
VVAAFAFNKPLRASRNAPVHTDIVTSAPFADLRIQLSVASFFRPEPG